MKASSESGLCAAMISREATNVISFLVYTTGDKGRLVKGEVKEKAEVANGIKRSLKTRKGGHPRSVN